MLSMRKLRLTFSRALSISSCAMERLARRARKTGRHAAKTPLTCERAEEASTSECVSTFGAADGSARVSLRIDSCRSVASVCSLSEDKNRKFNG